MDTYRITAVGQAPVVMGLRENEAFEYKTTGAKVEILFFGRWFPVRMGSGTL